MQSVLDCHTSPHRLMNERVIMSKKENKCISVDALNKYYKKQDSLADEVAIEIGDGIVVHVKKSITANQFVTAVAAGVASCFDDDEYLPWLKDIAYMHAVLVAFTDIDFDGVDVESEFFLVTATDVYDKVLDKVNENQLFIFENAFEEQLQARVDKINSTREKELNEALSMLKFVTQKYNEVSLVFKEVMGSDLSEIISIFSKNAESLKASVSALAEDFSKYIAEQGDSDGSV